ncbi:MDR family NADP-dependent oxidoreductase [Aspergillus puulaauensis]|uniref:Enoyl reductase (ER) domain-containing protein n=1 Tax=Aspergillus puulaauensis TaxID=1220207 RepID=A0A7R7XID0_9EURO|nr:uncharacterized protein APUU_30097S [Aspergillus puulaauensis]BCS21872.1 hypothetical protein APUU_30097S [Aspergillus puulaauensis]
MDFPTETKCWVLAKKPTGKPVISGAHSTFRLETRQLPSLKPGQILLKTCFLSNDPAQRMWIDAELPADRLYLKPIEVGQVMASRGIGRVLSSRSSKIKAGSQVVVPNIGWTEYAVLSDQGVIVLEPLPLGLSVTHYLGALGNTGLTAYYGLVVQSEAKPQDTVIVSGAAGATGSMVIQIAKKIIGCKRVIGIAGTDEKCQWVESLGADLCLNYKSESFVDNLKKGTAGGVDVFFDCVGGAILDQVLPRMSKFGRIEACGAISGYNEKGSALFENWFHVVSMRLKIQGFIVLDYAAHAQDAIEVLKQAIADRKLVLGEQSQTINSVTFQDIPKVWLWLFEGGNTGKLITAL